MFRKHYLWIGFLFLITLLLIFAWKRFIQPDIHWGATSAQIKQEQGTPDHETENTLVYQTLLFEQYPVATEYQFQDARLSAMRQVSLKRYQNVHECLVEYRDLQRQFKQQYGSGMETIEEGFRFTVWHTPHTQIVLTIWTDSPWRWVVEYQRR